MFILCSNAKRIHETNREGIWADDENPKKQKKFSNISVAGTWTRVSRVRAEYPNQLDYNGECINKSSLFTIIAL